MFKGMGDLEGLRNLTCLQAGDESLKDEMPVSTAKGCLDFAAEIGISIASKN